MIDAIAPTLYHGTYNSYEPGTILVAPPGEVISLKYEAATRALEAARPDLKPSRIYFRFASDRLDGVSAFAKRKRPQEIIGPNVYTVAMSVFHRAPMAMVSTLSKRLSEDLPAEALLAEYWNPSLTLASGAIELVARPVPTASA